MELSVDLTKTKLKAATLEMTYTQMQDLVVHQWLQGVLCNVLLLRTLSTKVHLLHQTQQIFKQGEKTGRLLAGLAKEHFSAISFPCIIGPAGVVLTDPVQINAHFAAYYQDVYDSRAVYSKEEVSAYLADVDLPQLTST